MSMDVYGPSQAQVAAALAHRWCQERTPSSAHSQNDQGAQRPHPPWDGTAYALDPFDPFMDRVLRMEHFRIAKCLSKFKTTHG